MTDIRRVDCHVHYVATDVQPAEWQTRAASQQGMMRVALARPAWRDLPELAKVMDATKADLALIIPNHVTFPELRGRSSADAYEAYNRSMSRDLAESGLGA